jgi:hypothetical protein
MVDLGIVGLGNSVMLTDLQARLVAAVAERVARRECILFLGAGVHSPPPEGSAFTYPEVERPPLGGDLAEYLATQCGFREKFPKESPRNLQRVSFCHELQEGKGRADLVAEVDRMVNAGKRPSPVVRALAALDFPLVITTNYDQLFERALAMAGKIPQTVVYNKSATEPTPDPMNWSFQDPLLFKIHGDIKRPESIVITDEDYIHFILRMSDKEPFHPVPLTFLYYFKKWPTLFVGYSLLDYNLRLLFKTLRWKIDRANIPNTFSVDPFPDVLIKQSYGEMEKYVSFIAQDVWTFVPDLYRQVRKEEMPR